MNKNIIASSLFFVVGVGLAVFVLANPLGWNWAGDVGQRLGVTTPPSAEPMEGMSSDMASDEREILYWTAPMDAAYIRDEPGQSPMGMDLVPVYADELGDVEGLVQIDPGFVQNIGVRSVDVERTSIPHTIRTIGTFTYDDSRVSWINTKFEGWIENVQVNFIGEEVQIGQQLFDIFSPQLVSTQQEYLDAMRYVERLEGTDYPEVIERARALVESARQRLRYWDITDEQIEALVAAGEPRRALTVVSPVTGLVVEKMDQALEGMLARPGMNLYKIADMSTIWIEAEVYEDEIPWLRVGQQARIELPNQPGRVHTGTIRYLYPFLDASTRTLKLSIELPNPGRDLRAEMYANVTLDVPSASGILAVPEEAVLRSGERNVIVLDLGGGRFQVREVMLGVNGNGLWEIRDGISEGERVVVSSQFLIDSESNLREAIRKLTTEASPDMDSTDMGGMDMSDSESETAPVASEQ
jgi:RND family efflux transporter MFP subunit